MSGHVPAGPLAVRWHRLRLGNVRAGTQAFAEVELENAGSAAWRDILLSYHWLDLFGNAIVWDGLRTPFAEPIAPGHRARVALRLRGPMPPGRYRLALDLVDEGRVWFEEVGNRPLEQDVDVAPRIPRALAVRGGDPEALAAQEEPLVEEADAAAIAHLADGCAPSADWSRRILDVHQEGYAVVGGAVEPAGGLLERRRLAKALAPWKPGGGRVPRFQHPLLCPSLVLDVEGDWLDPVEGLPALRPPDDEPWIYDGRIVVTARPRSGHPRG
jgi:hypothetical protein